MTWLSPWTIAIAAGLTVPPLVALYFLKLKRRVQVISSTLLWKRAVYDLQVNSPFQRLRKNLLLLLQLFVLALAAAALGKPMMQMLHSREKSLILLIDQSASMNVLEGDGRTRLEMARDQAKTLVDGMDDAARAMIIAFSDRATTVSPFESNRDKLKRLIDGIEPTQSLTELAEAMTLAEAYSQNFIIAGNAPGSDIAPPKSIQAPSTAIIFSDGRVADASTLNLERLPLESIELVGIGRRQDNVGITAMSARRDYEKPEILQVFAGVENFGPEPVRVDAALYIDGVHKDVQELSLAATTRRADPQAATDMNDASNGEPDAEGLNRVSQASVSFDAVEWPEGCLVEVRLQAPDALDVDNRAWTVVPPSKAVSVLLVTEGNLFLERVLASLAISLTVMTPTDYESAPDDKLADGPRSKFDVVIFDQHDPKRLAVGNFMFWGCIPESPGLGLGDWIDSEYLVNWDEAHPVLRHVAVEGIVVDRWRSMISPTDARVLVEGESTPVLIHLARGGSQFLISAFALVIRDPDSGQPMLNTNWIREPDFVPFMENSVRFLSGSIATSGLASTRPGDPVEIAVAESATEVMVRRPDGTTDRVEARGYTTVHYAKTRTVGVYHAEPGVPGRDRFAVNLFSADESFIAPAPSLAVGQANVAAQAAIEKVNDPVWAWFLLAGLLFLAVEWLVYIRRVEVR